jgi:hypothetical protein
LRRNIINPFDRKTALKNDGKFSKLFFQEDVAVGAAASIGHPSLQQIQLHLLQQYMFSVSISSKLR